MTYAKNINEAEKRAWAKFYGEEELNHCLYNESNPKLTETDEWLPEIETSYTGDGLGWRFSPSPKTRVAIAKKLNKEVEDLTEEDLTNFIKVAVEKGIKE